MMDHIGEVIEASTTRFRAQRQSLDNPPAFGSFVKVPSGPEITSYAVVFNVYESSIDPSRRPVAFGLTEKELKEQQPQIFEMLRLEFEAAIIGFKDQSAAVKTYLPPWPPRIHSFVGACTPDEVSDLTNELEFIRSINALPGLPTDELLAAAVRTAYRNRDCDDSFLIKAGQEIAIMLKDEYERARSILRRVGHVEA
ncbi:MAG: HAS-barrel domain-containing protein [Candidatus Aquicultorales bacterium]